MRTEHFPGYEVSLSRLHALRAAYLLLLVGLGTTVWPDIIRNARSFELMDGVVSCMLGAVALLAAVGLRYPLQMLPLLMFELAWKSIWLLVVALPPWLDGRMDDRLWPTTFACLLGIVFPVVIPWRYVLAHYARKRGDRWR